MCEVYSRESRNLRFFAARASVATRGQFRSLLRKELSERDLDRLDKSLKVLANATSYGIVAEMNRQESEKRIKVRCHGLDPEPYECSVIHPEQPGEFCFRR
jgi:hypothetical protein